MGGAGSVMRGLFMTMLTLAVSGCASRDLWPVERVDPDTAVHLTIMAEPWMYVLDDPRQAANASQFLNVTLIESNRTGTRSYWLNAVAWNTGKRGEDGAQRAGEEPVQLLLGRPTTPLQLVCSAGRSAAAITEPAITVRGARLMEAWCPLSAGQAAGFGAGAPTAISLVDADGYMRSYVSWQVDGDAVREFLKATGAGMN